MPLNATEVKNAEAKEKDYKLYDGKGLLLLVKKNGSKYWRFKYRTGGKEKTLSLGVYPEVTLAQARIATEEARAKLRDNIDPMVQRKTEKLGQAEAAENTFKSVAKEWLKTRTNKAAGTEKRLISLLERYLYPSLGGLPIKEISATQLLQTLKVIESSLTVLLHHN